MKKLEIILLVSLSSISMAWAQEFREKKVIIHCDGLDPQIQQLYADTINNLYKSNRQAADNVIKIMREFFKNYTDSIENFVDREKSALEELILVYKRGKEAVFNTNDNFLELKRLFEQTVFNEEQLHEDLTFLYSIMNNQL